MSERIPREGLEAMISMIADALRAAWEENREFDVHMRRCSIPVDPEPGDLVDCHVKGDLFVVIHVQQPSNGVTITRKPKVAA